MAASYAARPSWSSWSGQRHHHGVALRSRWLSSHARATVHWRFTVAGDNPITSPVSSIVYIFCARIGEASVKYLRECTRLLGLVMAHEMGHVLLPVYSHSDTGIMRAGVDWWTKTINYFTADQGEAIRSMLLRESQTGS